MAKKLSKKVKSLFVAASVIAVVVGGVEIAATRFNLFQPDGPGQQASTAPAQTNIAANDDNDDDTTASTSEQAPPPAPTQSLPGMIPGTSNFGFIGPAGQSSPVIAAPQSTDVTGSIAAAPRPRGPAQAVPMEQIPVAIGSAKLREAAHNGDGSAAYEIAVRFADGRGVATNMTEAARWFERAAQAGFAAAQFRPAASTKKARA
jgi:localization factor PodJL